MLELEALENSILALENSIYVKYLLERLKEHNQ